MHIPTVLENLLSVLALASIGLACFGVGAPLVRLLRLAGHDRLVNATWSLALGAVAAGVTLMSLGFLGLLYGPLIGLLTMAAGFWGLGETAQALYVWRDETLFQLGPDAPWTPRLRPTPANRATVFLASAAAIAALGALVGALAPPTAGDALCYHLELPKTFLERHSIAMLPYDDNVTYPLLAELWFLWAMALDGPVAAQLVHWSLGLMLVLATFDLAAPVLGRHWGLAAGLAMALVPAVTNQMTAPLNDLALAVFTTLALSAWRRGWTDDDPPRWMIAAGVMGGAALSIKYLAALAAVAAVATAAIQAWRYSRRRAMLEHLLTVAIVAAAIAGPWYLRAAWIRQNPVYPFFSHLIGKPGPQPAPAAKRPLSWAPADALTAPWQVTMRPDRFGGRGHQLGPLFLAALPAVLAARRLRGLGELGLIAALFMVQWYLLRQNIRFLLPALPLLCVAGAWGLIETARWPTAARRTLLATLGLVAATLAVAPWVRARDQLAVAIGVESRASYLQRREPTYRAAALANAMLVPGDRLLSQDYRSFYFRMPVVRESIFRRETGYDRQAATDEECYHRLRQHGFTHVLLAEANGSDGIRFDDTLRRLVDSQPQDLARRDGPLCISDYRFVDADGQQRRYRLMMLR